MLVFSASLFLVRFAHRLRAEVLIQEAPTNLVNWSAISTNITTFTNTDLAVTNYPYRFYRARNQQ